MRTNDATHATSWQRNRPRLPQIAGPRLITPMIAATLLLTCSPEPLAQGLNLLWARSGGGASEDGAYGVALDALNNAYVIGSYHSTASFGAFGLTNAGGADVFLTKYDTTGAVMWPARAGGARDDQGYGIIVDRSEET